MISAQTRSAFVARENRFPPSDQVRGHAFPDHALGDLDRPPPRISAAKSDPRIQRVILLHQAGRNIRAVKIPAIDRRDEC
jgi:hypothetical protein